MTKKASPDPPAQWVHLADVDAREWWFGPLQANVRVSIFDRGIGVERTGPARFFRGRRPAVERFPFAMLDARPAAQTVGEDTVLVKSVDTGEIRALVGPGASSLGTLLSVMATTRSSPLAALRGARFNFIGGMANGTILAADDGLVFIPEAGAGGWLASRTPLRVEALSHVSATADFIQIWSKDSSGPVFEISTESSPAVGFVHWWSSSHAFDTVVEQDQLPVLWLAANGVAGPARVHLIHGGIHIESVDGRAPELRTAGIHIEDVQSFKVRGGATCIRFEVLGRAHHLWLEGAQAAVLSAHLKRHDLGIWRDDFQPDVWSEVAGQGLTLRFAVRGAREIVLHELELELHADGLRVELAEGDVETVETFRGKRVEVEVVSGRRQYQFRAIHLGIERGAVSAGTTDAAADDASSAEAPDPTPTFTLRLYPVGDGPSGVSQRRGHFRLRVEEELKAKITLEASNATHACVIRELSAAGAQIACTDVDVPKGSVFQLELVSGVEGVLSLRSEAVHVQVTKSGTSVLGVRFLDLDENLQSHVQREVLHLQRQQNKRRDVEDNLPSQAA